MKKLLLILIILNLHCSLVNKYVIKHGGIFGRVKIIAEEDNVKKNRILEEISLKIKGTDIYPEKDEAGFFWFNGLKSGTYTIEYVHPEYETHELRNVDVITDKYTMAVCRLKPKRFKEINNNNYRYIKWNKEGEKYGMLSYSLNPEKRGTLELHFKYSISNANIIIIADAYYATYGARNGEGTIWSTTGSGKSHYLENILPGRYDIIINTLKYHTTHVINVIIKYNYKAVLNVPLSSKNIPEGVGLTESKPIYKRIINILEEK